MDPWLGTDLQGLSNPPVASLSENEWRNTIIVSLGFQSAESDCDCCVTRAGNGHKRMTFDTSLQVLAYHKGQIVGGSG